MSDRQLLDGFPPEAPDPYICQRCGRYYRYLDLMSDPECDCGSIRFWPAPEDKMVLAIIISLSNRLRAASKLGHRWIGFENNIIMHDAGDELLSAINEADDERPFF